MAKDEGYYGPMVDDYEKRVAQLEAALRTARQYVHAFAQNAPHDEGGSEAVSDLASVDSALGDRT